MEPIQIIRGNFIFTETPRKFTSLSNQYMVIEDGRIKEVYAKLPNKFKNQEVIDYSQYLMIPGLIDLHVHAPQFDQIGLGLDKELIDWLNTYTFPLESQFADPKVAEEVYGRFVKDLIRQGTTRAAIFATIHKESTRVLYNTMIKNGIGGYVGKVNMDQNSSDTLREDWKQSLRDTDELIQEYYNHPLVKPIITPRFAPSCTPQLLKGLGKLAEKYVLPVQSHLSENPQEVEWVAELFPKSLNYADVYDQYGLLGDTPTLMAHGIYLTEDEIEKLAEKNVVIVHCPDSNMNIASGMMPARRWLNRGVKLGIGSDVGGGHNLSMAQSTVRAIQTSKLLQTITGERALTVSEAFYMTTKGGGSFFGKIGSFEKGYEFDALVIQDEPWVNKRLTLCQRLERWLYSGDDRNIIQRYVSGKKIEC